VAVSGGGGGAGVCVARGANVGRLVAVAGGGTPLVGVGCATVGSTIGVCTTGDGALTVAVDVADGVFVAPGVTVGTVGSGV
jgi:hypothetical protein